MVSPYLEIQPVSEAQFLAEAAGFTFKVPASTLAIIGSYTPCAPEFARFGRFALYLRACCDEASQRDIHRGTVSSRYADPIAARVMLLAEALEDTAVSNRHIGLELNLNRYLSDVIYASRRDPDRARRLEFAVVLYADVADQFDKLRLFARARDYWDRAKIVADAMRKMNEATIAAE